LNLDIIREVNLNFELWGIYVSLLTYCIWFYFSFLRRKSVAGPEVIINRLTEEVKRLQTEKVTLTSQLTTSQASVETCHAEHGGHRGRVSSLHMMVGKLERDNAQLQVTMATGGYRG
jgi:hypothetical protein